MTIVFSKGSHKGDAHPKRHEVATVEEFVEKIDGWRQPTKGKGYICAGFSDGHRSKDTAMPVHFICPDMDRIAAERLPDLCMWLAGFSGAGWDTHSSTPEAPRMRGVLMLDREATRDEVLRLGAAFEAEAKALFGDDVKLDGTTWKIEQPAYLPPTKIVLARYMGDAIDVDAWLARPTAVAPAGGSDKSTQQRADDDAERDPVLRALREKNMVFSAHRTPGWFNVTCPCSGQHEITSSPSSTTYMLPAYGGRRFGRFHCLHHPCANRPQEQFLEALGLEPKAVWSEQAGGAAPPVIGGSSVSSDTTTRPLDIFRAVAAPPFDPALFPAVLREFAVPLAAAAGHDEGAYLMAGLAAAAAAINDDVRLAVVPKTKWYESARLWVLLMGPPGSAKTPATRAPASVLWALHRELREQYERDTAGMGEDDERPPMPAVIATDATIEKLSEILHDNPRGILTLYEELDSWLGSHDAYRGGQGSKDRGEWLRLFDGGPHQVDRVKRGSFFVKNWGASILGATTPAGLRRHAKDLPPDGLIQRFLPCMVRPMVKPDNDVPEGELDAGRHGFEERMREMFGAQPGYVHMTPAATALFLARRDALRAEVEAVESLSEPMAGHMAKHAALTARIALTMHMLDNGAAGVEVLLEEKTMRDAIGVMRNVTRHALALFLGTLANGDTAGTVAQAAARSIVAGKLELVTRSTLMHHCRAFREATEHVREAALRFLVDASWLTPIDEGRQYGGKPASYAVHHECVTLFGAEGEALKQRRRQVRELIAG
jgi:hypothetical protein